MSTSMEFAVLHRQLTQLGFNQCQTALLIQKHDFLLIEQDDAALAASILRLLREEDTTAPISLTAAQFAQRRFASPKIAVCLALLRLVRPPPTQRAPTRSRKSDCLIAYNEPRMQTTSSIDAVENYLLDERRRALNRSVRV